MISMGRLWIAGAIVLVACNARLGSPTNHHDVDASSGGSNGGGNNGPDASMPPPADAALACYNGRVVYLNFDGVMLAQAGTDDATQNQASWIGVAAANVPQYHAGNTNRLTQIQNITTAVQQILGTFPIEVVTTRPANGPYVMVVFGGNLNTVGTMYSYATASHDCGDTVKSDVGWVSDTVPTSKAADYAVGAIGWALGLQGTSDPSDCMCEWANGCVQNSTHCALHGPITTTQSQANTNCAGALPSQDENAAFSAAFCM